MALQAAPGIYDVAGRYLAPLPVVAPVLICAWCPTWDCTDPANAGASHGICPACRVRVDDELDMLEAA